MADILYTSGFTPLFDIMVENTSHTTAVVYGLVERYSRMRNGVCKASIETLAEKVGVSRQTIQRHLSELVEKGYIKKLNPGLTGHPNEYVPTEKVYSFIGDKNEATSQSLPEEEGDVAASDGGYAIMEQGVSHNGTRDVPQRNTKRLLRDNIDKKEREAHSNLINIEADKESTKDKETPLKENNVMIKRDSEEKRIDDIRIHLKDDQLAIRDSEEEQIKKEPRERNNVTGSISEKQRIALEVLGKAMRLNFILHKDAPILGNFLISAYAKRQGPNQYAEWASYGGNHKEEMARYAAFPKDIIAEWPQAFCSQYFMENDKDTQLFANELKDFVPVMSDEILDVSKLDVSV